MGIGPVWDLPETENLLCENIVIGNDSEALTAQNWVLSNENGDSLQTEMINQENLEKFLQTGLIPSIILPAKERDIVTLFE